MRTLSFKINVDEEEKKILEQLEKEYSIDFRKIYNNLDLTADKEFMNSLNMTSSKLKEYTIKEVIAFYEKYQSTKERLKERIDQVQEKLNIETKPKKKNKLFKHLTNLKRSYKSNICFGGRNNLMRRTKGLISNEEWKELRTYPMTFYGETSRKGNRFFDFKNISNGNILFKLESTKIKIPLKITTKKYKDILPIIEHLTNNKEISITVKLSSTNIYITYDESILNGTNFDYRLYQKEKPKDLTKEESNKYWHDKHREHENSLKRNKLNRYLSIDVNPNEIGFIITDKNLNIIDKGSYIIEGKISDNKRKYEYSMIVKQLFNKIKHYKVSYFVIEDLELNKDNYGNKKSNRLIKLEFKKNFIFSLVERRCNETGTILGKVNPCYSSFIGNLTFKEYDPIASALEICRRGIGQFTSGFKLIPEYDLDNIFTDRIDGYVDLSKYKTYTGLFEVIRNKSYRRKDKTFLSQSFTQSDKSHVCLYG